MFSLVTALVSPCVVESLAHKKEALVAALQENASVVCSHPADSVCLLQGEWENVKKAYAIVEEFYLRSQAEAVVRRMLKVEPADPQSDYTAPPCGLVGGRIPPDQVLSLLLSPPPTDEGEQSAVNKPDGRRSPFSKNSHSSGRSCSPETLSHLARQQRTFLYQHAAAGSSSEPMSDMNGMMNGVVDLAGRTRCSQDDSPPPVLSREGNIDDVSDLSSSSDAHEADMYTNISESNRFCSVSSVESTSLASTSLAVTSASKDCSGKLPAESGGPRPASSSMATVEKDAERAEMVPTSRRLNTMPSGDRSALFNASSDGCSRGSQQQIEVNGSARLPQIASLFSGSVSGALSAWPYAELYSAHLSAMRSICEATVKRESNIDPSDFGEMHRSASYRPEDDPLAPEMRCSRCDKTYRSEARMREHARTHDAGYVAVLHACPKCGKAFTYRHNMVVHLRRFHYGWQPAKRHACRTCGMRFQKPYLLRLHERKAHMPVQLEPGQLSYGPS